MHEAYNTFGAEPTRQAVRVGPWKWIEYRNGETELYDVLGDPYELENRAADPSLTELRKKLHRLWLRFSDCVGQECVVTGYGDDWQKKRT